MPTNPLIQQALNKYGTTTAGLDLEKATLKDALARRLGLSKENRGKSIVAGRENLSARGMLQSGPGLMDFADRNKQYDTYDDELNSSATNQFNMIENKRAASENDYYTTKLGLEAEDARNTPLLTAGVPPGNTIDPSIPTVSMNSPYTTWAGGPSASDPNNWTGIRRQQLMAIINGPDDPNDPNNWQKIAAMQELAKLPPNEETPNTVSDNPLRGRI